MCRLLCVIVNKLKNAFFTLFYMSRFCQSRIKAHRDSELDDDFRRTLNGLKHNVSYGFNMPQMHMFQQDRTDTNVSQLYVHYIQFIHVCINIMTTSIRTGKIHNKLLSGICNFIKIY